MSEGHAVRRLVGRVAEHDALVAGADVHLVLADVDAARDVRRLLVDAHEHLAGVAGQALGVDGRQIVLEGVEANFSHLSADDLVVVELGLGRDLIEDHDHVVLGRRLAGDLRVGSCLRRREAGIRDLVRELVGVALVHGLGREEEDAPVFPSVVIVISRSLCSGGVATSWHAHATSCALVSTEAAVWQRCTNDAARAFALRQRAAARVMAAG